jgi:hypothetical protein
MLLGSRKNGVGHSVAVARPRLSGVPTPIKLAMADPRSASERPCPKFGNDDVIQEYAVGVDAMPLARPAVVRPTHQLSDALLAQSAGECRKGPSTARRQRRPDEAQRNRGRELDIGSSRAGGPPTASSSSDSQERI